jgi:uncharacterized protein (DUF1697 family)
MRYVALLRGINVGGNNLLAKGDLIDCFEKAGMKDVTTFIASGNVLFESSAAQKKLVPKLEAALSKRFNYAARVTLRSHDELERIVTKAPKGFGKSPDAYRYDVIFLFDGVTAEEAVPQLEPKEGVDAVWGGTGVIYFSRLVAKAAQSRLSKVASLPIYKEMTIRNWNTTSKLLALL